MRREGAPTSATVGVQGRPPTRSRLTQASDDEDQDAGDEGIGGDGEHRARLPDPAQVAPDDDRYESKGHEH